MEELLQLAAEKGCQNRRAASTEIPSRPFFPLVRTLNRFSRFVETTAVVHEPPLAPPEYRGGGHATILFIPPLYSGGARGGRPTIDLWRLAFVKVFPRIVKRDLATVMSPCDSTIRWPNFRVRTSVNGRSS